MLSGLSYPGDNACPDLTNFVAEHVDYHCATCSERNKDPTQDGVCQRAQTRDYLCAGLRYGAKSLSRPRIAAMKQTPLCSVTVPVQPS